MITPGGGRDTVNGRGGVDRMIIDHSNSLHDGRFEVNVNGSFYGVAQGTYPTDRVEY